MSEITISKDLAKAIVFENYDDSIEVVEEGGWVNAGKYQFREIIFKKDGKLYELSVSRSGSYHTDWYYNWEYEEEFTCPEVEKVTITKEVWMVKK